VTEYLNDLLTQIQGDRVLLVVSLIVAAGVGMILCSIAGTIRDQISDYRWQKREQQAKFEVDRIRSSWNEEEYSSDEWAQINQDYHTGEQRRLRSDWREDTVINEPYPSQRYQFQSFEAPTQQWPTWTEEELRLVGRRRAEDNPIPIEARPVSPAPGYSTAQLRALVGRTGAYELVG